jgi:hypothetical protein
MKLNGGVPTQSELKAEDTDVRSSILNKLEGNAFDKEVDEHQQIIQQKQM